MKKSLFSIVCLTMLLAMAACSRCPKGAVDMGIVMTREDGSTYKLYWAKSNLSESGLCANPEDYGDYFAWGETETKSDYSWSTYKFSTGSSGDYYPNSKFSDQSPYDNADNKTTLETGPDGDDAASKILGGGWRMPTDEEWEELRTKCTWKWTDNYNGKGAKGIIVTAKNGNSIFLPAAGYRNYTRHDCAGSRGEYWSSSLNTDSPCYAWISGFNIDCFSKGTSNGRCCGYSVRAVSE